MKASASDSAKLFLVDYMNPLNHFNLNTKQKGKSLRH